MPIIPTSICLGLSLHQVTASGLFLLISLSATPLIGIKKSFANVVPDISKFSTHSTRSGGATLAASSGVSERNLQRHGRWASATAKNIYVKDSLARRLEVSKSLSL